MNPEQNCKAGYALLPVSCLCSFMPSAVLLWTCAAELQATFVLGEASTSIVKVCVHSNGRRNPAQQRLLP